MRCLLATLVLASVSNVSFAADQAPQFALNAIAIGASGRTDLGLGMLEARAVLSPHLLVTAAPTILTLDGADPEYQFRGAITLLMQRGPVRLDDRNLWVFSDAGTMRYRNRLRVTVPVEIEGRNLRLQLLDEVFYQQGGRGWFRNLIGAGVGIDVHRSVSVDAYWMLQDDENRPQTSMFVVVLTARLFASARTGD